MHMGRMLNFVPVATMHAIYMHGDDRYVSFLPHAAKRDNNSIIDSECCVANSIDNCLC